MYEPETYNKWKICIERHQQFLPGKLVCMRHFEKHQFCSQSRNRSLQKGAIPSIFIAVEYPISAVQNEIFECDESLQTTIDELKKQILQIKAKHDIEIQKISKQKETMQNVTRNLNIHKVQHEKMLKQAQSTIAQLNNCIEEIRNEKYFDTKDSRFDDVSNSAFQYYVVKLYTYLPSIN